MRLPYSWLRDTVQAGAPGWDVSPDELEQTLIRIGHEVEEVIPVGPVSGPLTVGRVAEIEELTEFKKPIRAVKVDVGESELRDIVCGATNFAVGDLVMVALPGSVLPGDFAIATRKTYGRTSDGMICSATELNLGTDHSGILVLPPGTAEPGAPAADLLGLDDVVFHLAITPDRGYCLSVRGMAREIANAYDLDYVDPASRRCTARRGGGAARHDRPGDWRAALRTATGHRNRPNCGVAMVDAAKAAVVRYPRHLARGRRDELRDARDGASHARARPESDHRRVPGSLRRTGGDGPSRSTTLSVASIPRTCSLSTMSPRPRSAARMGAGTTEVRDSTTDVLLEAAVWDPAAVSRTQRRLHLVSEAGRRYERTVDPAISVAALDRCAMLLAEIANGRRRTHAHRLARRPAPRRLVTAVGQHGCRPARPHCGRRLRAGHHREAAHSDRRRRSSSTTVFSTATPPSWRPDLRQPADLVEEVLRLEGLEIIPSVLPQAPAGRGLSAVQKRRRAIGKSLALNGCVEILPTPFLPAGTFDQWGLPPDHPRRSTTNVMNPLDLHSLSWPPRCCRGYSRPWAATYPAGRSTRPCSLSPRSSNPLRKPALCSAFRPDRRPTEGRGCHAGRVPAPSAAACRRGAGRSA